MICRSKVRELQLKAAHMLKESGFPLTSSELEAIAVADFGLGKPEVEGAQILTLFSTDRISAKLIMLFNGQILPEHWHPRVGDDPGKEEIIRGYSGTVFYFDNCSGVFCEPDVPNDKSSVYTCRSRLILTPGLQVIVPPGRKHWLQGGPGGGCVISFSTCVRDILDQFTDKSIIRTTQIKED